MSTQDGLVGFDQHLRDCLDVVRVMAPLDVPLSDALDLVLAEDVVADAPLPGADNSAMDGYAVHACDVLAAGADTPVRLPVVADVMAGAGTPSRLPPGAAVRIMTGGVIPDGADAIVPVEDTDAGVSAVNVLAPTEGGRYVRRAGDDVEAGETVLVTGPRLAPRAPRPAGGRREVPGTGAAAPRGGAGGPPATSGASRAGGWHPARCTTPTAWG